MLTPLELRDRLAALIPPPRRHRHRDYGVLAPNAPLCSAVTGAGRLLNLRKRPFASPERDGCCGSEWDISSPLPAPTLPEVSR
jgi:hypothetical protein